MRDTAIVADAVRDRFVIAAHHPDRLLRPAPTPGLVSHERLLQALTWNVFRTLELITPAFWLRRLHARLMNDSLRTAAQIVRVRLWTPLPLPPAERLDGARPPVTADVVIETEDAVWTLVVSNGADYDGAAERIAQALAAGEWLSGVRSHFAGIVDYGPAQALAPGTLLRTRYLRSRHSAALRFGAARRGAAKASAPGVLDWAALAEVMEDCAGAEVLPEIERTLAAHALAWLNSVGIVPRALPLDAFRARR